MSDLVYLSVNLSVYNNMLTIDVEDGIHNLIWQLKCDILLNRLLAI